MKALKRAKIMAVTLSTAFVSLGILMILFPQISANVVWIMIGTVLIISGIFKLIGYFTQDPYRLAFQFDFALGVLSITVGIVMIACINNALAFFSVIIGIVICTDNVFRLQTSIEAKRFGFVYWWVIFLFTILSGFTGIFLITFPFEGTKAVMIATVVTLTISGLQNLCSTLYLVRSVKKEID